MVWTEIPHEDVAVVHVNGRHIITPIGDDVPARVGEQVADMLMYRQMKEQFREDAKALEQELEQQKRVRERLKGTEYEGML